MKKKLRLLILAWFCIITLFSVGCTANNSTFKNDINKDGMTINSTSKPQMMQGNVEFIQTFAKLNKLVDRAQYIFVGQVIEKLGARNLAEDKNIAVKEVYASDIIPGTDYKISLWTSEILSLLIK